MEGVARQLRFGSQKGCRSTRILHMPSEISLRLELEPECRILIFLAVGILEMQL